MYYTACYHRKVFLLSSWLAFPCNLESIQSREELKIGRCNTYKYYIYTTCTILNTFSCCILCISGHCTGSRDNEMSICARDYLDEKSRIHQLLSSGLYCWPYRRYTWKYKGCHGRCSVTKYSMYCSSSTNFIQSVSNANDE